MIALYFGRWTIVFGRGGVTIHPYTRGTVDIRNALFGAAYFRRDRIAERWSDSEERA